MKIRIKITVEGRSPYNIKILLIKYAFGGDSVVWRYHYFIKIIQTIIILNKINVELKCLYQKVSIVTTTTNTIQLTRINLFKNKPCYT